MSNNYIGALIASITDTTCGEACWNAKEEVCRCECGGANHGIARHGGTAERGSKIDGYKYKLEAVGTHKELSAKAETINSKIIFSIYWDSAYNVIRMSKRDIKDRGAAARVKYATMPQIDKWRELETFRGKDRYHSNAAVLWVRKDLDELAAESVRPTLTTELVMSITKDASPATRKHVFYTAMKALGAAELDRPYEVIKDTNAFTEAWYEAYTTLDENKLKELEAESGVFDSGFQAWLEEN